MRLYGFQWLPMSPYISLFVPVKSKKFCWGFIGLYALLWILICFMSTYAFMWIIMGPDKDALGPIRTQKDT